MIMLTRGPPTHRRGASWSAGSVSPFVTDVLHALSDNGIQSELRTPLEFVQRAIGIGIFIISFFEERSPESLRVNKINRTAATGDDLHLLRQGEDRSFVRRIADVVHFARFAATHCALDPIHNVPNMRKSAYALAFRVNSQRLSGKGLLDEAGEHESSLSRLSRSSHVEGPDDCGMQASCSVRVHQGDLTRKLAYGVFQARRDFLGDDHRVFLAAIAISPAAIYLTGRYVTYLAIAG